MTSASEPVFCPRCHTRFLIEPGLMAGRDVVLLCGICATGFRPRDAQHIEGASEVQRTVDRGPRVVVGHEHPGAARTIASVLRQGGYAPLVVTRGEQVLAAFDQTMPERPVALCLDVGIPGVLAFEVIAHLRAHPTTTALPVVLLASVFERTRYKRRPSRLYGADTYLELHHVPDRLIEVIESLRAARPLEDERRQAPTERAQAAPLRDARDLTVDDDRRARARRLLMDVALYHGDEIGRGLKRGDAFGELVTPLAEARAILIAESGGDEAAGALFDDERERFSARLSERERARAVGDG